MGNKDLFDAVRRLELPIGKYAIFGGGQLCVREIRECHDVDIIVDEDLWNKYKTKPEWKLGKSQNGSDYLHNGAVELYKDWKPGDWDVKELIKNAEIIGNLPFVRIKHVIKWKRIYGREGDLKDIEMLEKYNNEKNK